MRKVAFTLVAGTVAFGAMATAADAGTAGKPVTGKWDISKPAPAQVKASGKFTVMGNRVLVQGEAAEYVKDTKTKRTWGTVQVYKVVGKRYVPIGKPIKAQNEKVQVRVVVPGAKGKITAVKTFYTATYKKTPNGKLKLVKVVKRSSKQLTIKK